MVNLIFLGTIITILIIAVIGLGIAWLALEFRVDRKPEDNPIIWNLMSHRSNGHAFGTVNTIKKHGSGRQRIFYDPKDLRPIDVLTKNWTQQDIIIDSDKLITLPRGDNSDHKNLIIACPKNPEDLSDHFKGSELGKLFAFHIEKKNVETSVVKAIREGSKRKDSILQELGDGELSAELFSHIKGILLDDLKDAISRSKEKQITTTSITHTPKVESL